LGLAERNRCPLKRGLKRWGGVLIQAEKASGRKKTPKLQEGCWEAEKGTHRCYGRTGEK